MNVLFFDIESNGLPKNKEASFQDVDNWPRIISLAWLIANTQTGATIYQQSHLIRPNGWTIPEETFWLMHGFSTEKSLADGVELVPVLDDFISSLDLNNVSLVVAHNLSFDHSVLSAEMYRHNLKTKRKTEKLCTMLVGKDVCKIPFGHDRRPWMNKDWKFPKLLELYQHLFGKGFEGAHDALSDCRAVRDCFFEMLNRKIIVLNQTQNV